MKVILFGDHDKNHYNNFLFNSEHKDILQSWEWGEVKSRFNWKIYRLGFFEGKELKGITQVFERRPSLGFSLFYIPRGPIIDWNDLNCLREILSCLRNFFEDKAGNKKYLFLRLEPPTRGNIGLEEIFRESGFKKYFKTVQPPSTLLIDLTPAEGALFKSFRRTARNLIYRSEREGIVIEILRKERIKQEDIRGFYNLYKLTGKRFSFPLRPLKQFYLLIEKMTGQPEVRFYIAKIKGLTLAYGIVLILGDKAFYIWGGTGRHKYYSKFFNYGYIWEILKDLKSSGVKTFDFWGLGPEDDKKHPWCGFTLFKKAFDGQRFDYIGAFDLPMSKFYPFFRLVDKIVTPKYRATSS